MRLSARVAMFTARQPRTPFDSRDPAATLFTARHPDSLLPVDASHYSPHTSIPSEMHFLETTMFPIL
ncbi:hypothetical protein M011DRAFT_91917 [Sporormia fimetaria CBS 119925]|uniref:Uncharacterized protein n=1 Tax=Sporormia fimetaria CBS 119925 TaxID=1340428 RepID=A0A6A6V8T2_9PLEO|nr:hypothetical protein M011DRAFT_91917 [Sporormia fimetaria CBS 119925]